MKTEIMFRTKMSLAHILTSIGLHTVEDFEQQVVNHSRFGAKSHCVSWTQTRKWEGPEEVWSTEVTYSWPLGLDCRLGLSL